MVCFYYEKHVCVRLNNNIKNCIDYVKIALEIHCMFTRLKYGTFLYAYVIIKLSIVVGIFYMFIVFSLIVLLFLNDIFYKWFNVMILDISY